MNASEFVGRVKIASPCRARWQDMTGDDRSRHCHQCRKQVYNFSAMSAEEIAALIRAKEGKLCGRFYRRRDGTMLTANCPIGAEKHFRRLKALAMTALTLLLTSLGLRAWSSWDVPVHQGPITQGFNNALWTVKGWLGLNPRVQTVGEIILQELTNLPPTPIAGTNISESVDP